MREGEAVEKGALLYTLDLDTATKDGGTQQRIIERRPPHGKCSPRRSIAKPE